MFLRRIFLPERKNYINIRSKEQIINDTTENIDSIIHDIRMSNDIKVKDSNNNHSNNNEGFHSNVRNEQLMGGLQLTPLWEHVLRTRRLPDTISPINLYIEFQERLHDPEWQVRQHALRVLVDVISVMGNKSDNHMDQLIPQLVENLGHQAPTVRKGALDCLRLYLEETAKPETIILQILDSGLSQQSVYDPCGGRLSCGVLLSLPALIQSINHKPQRHSIVQHIIKRLTPRMDELINQELTVKVLVKISELLGLAEFNEYMVKVGGNGARIRYEKLCHLYEMRGKETSIDKLKTGAWRAMPREQNWRNANVHQMHNTTMVDKGKVIMETEIKINEDTVTMRILEADTETEESDSLNRNYPNIIGTSEHACDQSQSEFEAGILQVISDSEMDETLTSPSQCLTPSRNLKRVTFGGEVVKIRTPDSDATSSASKTNIVYATPTQQSQEISILNEDQAPVPFGSNNVQQNTSLPNESKTTELTLEIISDNTKPLSVTAPCIQRLTDHSPQNTVSNEASPSHGDSQSNISLRSPGYVAYSTSISPVGSISISPKTQHRQIEVLHNLQRDPSPRSLREKENSTTSETPPVKYLDLPTTPKSWEDLNIVSVKTLSDLRSGDCRKRLQGVTQLEIALRSSKNLLMVQPYLESLLRTLLSSERSFDVAEEKRELLIDLIKRLPLDNLEVRTLQILTGLCRQGNAGANRVCKALMQRLPAATVVAKLTAPELLHAKSSKFRDSALQMSIYALMTFPTTCFDIENLSTNVVSAAVNRNRRVRHSALEVLAVLAEISTTEQILGIITEVTANTKFGPTFVSAVRARLSRRQLPSITPDGNVMFSSVQHNLLEPLHNSADIEWVRQGEGSATSNPRKKIRMRTATKQRTLQGCAEVKGKKYHSDESLQRHSFHTPPEAYKIPNVINDLSRKLGFCSKDSNAIHFNQMGRYSNSEACSETSTDGRSTDSTTTTCSSGSGNCKQISSSMGEIGRLTRKNSRFPATNHCVDVAHNATVNQSIGVGHNLIHIPSKGPMCISKDTCSKNNYIAHTIQQHSRDQPKYMRHQPFNQQVRLGRSYSIGSQDTFKATDTYLQQMQNISTNNTATERSAVSSISEALACDPNDASHSTSTKVETQASKQINGSPLSVKSTNYSQKSTASAKSFNSQKEKDERFYIEQEEVTLKTKVGVGMSEPFGEVIASDIDVENEYSIQEPTLIRNESVSSLHSKTESIKTQLEDITPQLSRAQSMKSLPIEEELEENSSFVVVEAMKIEATVSKSMDIKQLDKIPTTNETMLPVQPPMQSATNSSLCIGTKSSPEDWLMHSRSISLDSLYNDQYPTKQVSLDANAVDNSLQAVSQLKSGSLTVKAEHTPITQKSKTSYLLRNPRNRRVSPVKQSIKMSQAELFPQQMLRFDKPREAMLKSFDQLDSSNWEVNMTGLRNMVCLMRHHSECIDHHMHMVCIQLTRSVRNLRSQVARSACLAAAELFNLKSKYLENECDDLVCALLHRTADTNRFLRADATCALVSMVNNLQPSKILNILTTKGAQHQNALVRTTTAKLLFGLVERLGSDRVYAMGRENRDKFFVVGANLLLEGSLETRSYAKSLFRALSEHSSYQRLLLDVIPARTYRNVEKTLRSITH